MESFDTLVTVLEPGYEVVVWDESGDRTRGPLLSISGEEVVVSRRRLGLLWSPEEVMFAADSIARVDIVDSTWNGIAIGAAVGVGVVLGVGAWESRQPDSNLKGMATFIAILGLPLSMRMGHDIDLYINEPIFERPSQEPRVTVAPLLGRNRGGLMVMVSF